jgi:hypothetical protein
MNGATPKEKTGRLEKYAGYFIVVAGFDLNDEELVRANQVWLMRDAERYFIDRNPGKAVWGTKVEQFEERRSAIDPNQCSIFYEISLIVEE